MSLFSFVDFPVRGDSRGNLIAIESNISIPFDIKRIYYIYGTARGESRGFHAHHELEQVAVCVKGKCKIVFDDGKVKETVWLDSPSKGVTIKKKIWHEMYEFSEDCIMLVLASDHYKEIDYIRNYDEFLEGLN